jgi:replication factor A1
LRNKVSVGEYLAFLSLKYDVDPDQLFRALCSAWENLKATCGEILIQCRNKTREKAVFLMTKDSKVVSQFSIPRDFLLEKANPIKTWQGAEIFRRRAVKKSETTCSSQIKDLKVGMRKINLTAKVLEIPKPTFVFTRFGNYASVANASVTDETGTVKLCLWNEQIGAVSTGDMVQIENAHMSLFRGERQLRIGKNGKLSIVGKMGSVKLEN